MDLDLKLRAQKLLDEMESWFLSNEIVPPAYVRHQIDNLRAAITTVSPTLPKEIVYEEIKIGKEGTKEGRENGDENVQIYAETDGISRKEDEVNAL